MKEALILYNAHLDKINKHLEIYLETKRIAFPRFYFLSNDELIKILSNQKNHQEVQPHLRKCFDNIMRLEFVDKVRRFSAQGSEDRGRSSRPIFRVFPLVNPSFPPILHPYLPISSR